jgi:hypothetical protein
MNALVAFSFARNIAAYVHVLRSTRNIQLTCNRIQRLCTHSAVNVVLHQIQQYRHSIVVDHQSKQKVKLKNISNLKNLYSLLNVRIVL